MQRVWRERVLPCMHHQPTTKRAAFLLFAAYADRKDIGAAMTEQKRGEQIAFMYPQSTYSQRHSARQLPRVRIKTRQELEVQARNQVADEADPSYRGHSAGIEPEHRPFDSQALIHSRLGRKVAATRAPVPFDAEGENDLEEDESYYTTRHPTSSRRYQRIPDVTTTKGSVKVVEHHHQQPLRTHRQSLLPPRQSYSDEDEHLPSNRHRHIHPLFWIGVCGVLLVLGWMGLNFITSWYQGVQDDWTYGKQRHFEVDAVVGHGDSVNNPSHFTAENNNGQIIVIELPGGNVAKAKIYQIETVPGNVGNPPVKLSFQDLNGDGKPDLLVQIGDGSAMLYVTMFNNGIEFVSKL